MKPESSKAQFGVVFTDMNTCGTQPLVSKDTYCGLGNTSKERDPHPGCRLPLFLRFPLPGWDQVSVQEPECDQHGVWGACRTINISSSRGWVQLGPSLSRWGRAQSGLVWLEASYGFVDYALTNFLTWKVPFEGIYVMTDDRHGSLLH